MFYSRFPNIFTKIENVDSEDKFKQPYCELIGECKNISNGFSLKLTSAKINQVQYKDDRAIVIWDDGETTECLYDDVHSAALSNCIVKKLFGEFYSNEVFGALALPEKNEIKVTELIDTEYDAYSKEYKAKISAYKMEEIKLRNQKELEEKRKALEEEYLKKLKEELAEIELTEG